MNLYDSPIAARFYDLQHADDPLLADELALILDEMAKADGPAIDLGCGTGRILLPALAAGFDVCGCDSSGPFLDLLAEKARAQGLSPRVWPCNLSGPEIPAETFAFAFAAFRTFDHLTAPGAQKSFLTAVRRALRPDGCLLINIANPDPLDLEGAMGQRILLADDLRDPASGRRIVWWGTSRFDPETLLIRESSEYDLLDDDGRVTDSYYFPFSVRYTPDEEMTEMIRETGFKLLDCWGGFGREDYEVGTGDSIWVMRPASTDETDRD